MHGMQEEYEIIVITAVEHIGNLHAPLSLRALTFPLKITHGSVSLCSMGLDAKVAGFFFKHSPGRGF